MAALGVVLIAIGAILTFAVDRTVAGLDIDAVGWILMVVGVVSLLVGLVTQRGLWGWSTRTERQVSPDGRTVHEQQSSRPY